jgi:hypothetical protein
MRTFIGALVLTIAMAVMGGCASGTGAKSAAPPATQTDNGIPTKTYVMQSAGRGVLQLTASADSDCTSKDGSLVIGAHHFEFEVWLAPAAQTVDDAVANVGQVITDQFKNFQTTSTTDLTIAGSPARRLLGSGNEADDGDGGNADVIVFKVGDHVFVSCVHGEDLSPVAQQLMSTVVSTAQMP